MADENVTEKKNDPEKQGADPSKKTKLDIRNSKFLVKAGIMAVVVVLCAGTGFGLGRLLGRSSTGETARPAQQSEPTHGQLLETDVSQADLQKTWYCDFEPVVANLNEPGVTRYIRVALTLQISSELDSKKGIALIDEKKPLLKNWLTIYLASQTLEDIRGDRNLRRIQSDLLDAFNEKLFPDTKPLIKNVLFKECAIQ